ncbi:MAG: hypothetical protein NTZ56_11445 [Acidobacteria bacterium]|nr:hypothetical protein [Acidobacteriota bacterium]
MRTTINLTPEAYHIARAVARDRNQTMSEVISDFVTGGNQPAPVGELKFSAAGFPMLEIGGRVTSEDVRRILDLDDE